MDEQQTEVRRVKSYEVTPGQAEWLVAMFLTLVGVGVFAFWQHPNWLVMYAFVSILVKVVVWSLGAINRQLERHLDG